MASRTSDARLPVTLLHHWWRWAAIVWAALVVFQSTGMLHRHLALFSVVAPPSAPLVSGPAATPPSPLIADLTRQHRATDPSRAPLAPAPHGRHAEQRIVGPPPEEAVTDVSGELLPIAGPTEFGLVSPVAIPTIAAHRDQNPILLTLASRELPSRAPPSLPTA